MTSESLGAKARTAPGSSARGGLVTLGAQGIRIVIQFASTVILARLLSPDDFGLFALVLVVVNAGELVRDFGLTPASIQAVHITQAQKSRLFWIGIAVGVAFALIMALASPLIAAVIDHPDATPVSLCLAAIFVLNSAQAQHQAELARSRRFGVLAATEVVAQLAGMVVAVICALEGAGVWSLVAQALVAAAAQSVSMLYGSVKCSSM